MKRISIPLAHDLHQRLKVAAAMRGEPMTAIASRGLARELAALVTKPTAPAPEKPAR
ncbi:hypothetical protein [uncultured Thiocystis sp.]|jgi:hypothetical protein|uniref:hypothetical protein n=1 Tax=uncultured Thiocystis sp. TaxID=1202134 RepID=UPI0025F5BD94|nr:hypothetical protein [uncultured Thiocystis sp.]